MWQGRSSPTEPGHIQQLNVWIGMNFLPNVEETLRIVYNMFTFECLFLDVTVTTQTKNLSFPAQHFLVLTDKFLLHHFFTGCSFYLCSVLTSRFLSLCLKHIQADSHWFYNVPLFNRFNRFFCIFLIPWQELEKVLLPGESLWNIMIQTVMLQLTRRCWLEQAWWCRIRVLQAWSQI